MTATIENDLQFGKPNTLGKTPAVVERVLAKPALLDELFGCYRSPDEWVRLRASNAFKRVFRARPALFPPFADRFIALMGKLKQPSAQWTFCDIFRENDDLLTAAQRNRAKPIVARLLHESDDWIVVKSAIKTLDLWTSADAKLRAHVQKRIVELTKDSRKSVARAASMMLANLKSA